MSLYDGIDANAVVPTPPKTKGWDPSLRMLQTQLQAKKNALTKAKNERAVRAAANVAAPVVNLVKSTPKVIEEVEKTTRDIEHSFVTGDSLDQFEDEYDPRYPNDYEKIKKKKREAEKKAKEEKEREERKKRREENHSPDIKSGFSRRPALDSDSDDEYKDEERKRKMAQTSKAAIAPPTALIEQDQQSFAAPGPLPLSGGAGTQFAKNMAGSVAHKIMSKYGFKEGQGLGKGNHGISHALKVEKTGKRAGKIISSAEQARLLEEEKQAKLEAEEANKSVTALLKNPTKVVCLRNMVGPGEVDDDLQAETSEECSKYGEVKSCVIYELVDRDAEEAVRIFIEFERVESAIKALVDLNGRFFGGRTVQANFYNIEKFKNLQLAETLT